MSLPATDPRPALAYPYFPTAWQHVIWRNWGLVPPERLAACLAMTPAQLREQVAQLGLDPARQADPEWLRRGYLTIIRENWHLLDFSQICGLLDLTPAELAFILKEDDFFWHKMGDFKPTVTPPRYSPLTPDQNQRTANIRALTQRLLPDASWRRDDAFAFVRHFSRPAGAPAEAPAEAPAIAPSHSSTSARPSRIVYSYFALYGDPLLDPELDPFPDALLAEYARMNVEGVWLQGILYQLVEFPFDPSLSTGWQTRIANLRRLVERAARYGIHVYLYLNEPRAMNDAFFARYPELRGAREGDFWSVCTSQPAVTQYLENSAAEVFTRVPGLAGLITITMSENLTNCYSRSGSKTTCPRCAEREPWAVVAEVNNRLAQGARRAKPDARVICWNWAWPREWDRQVVSALTEGQIIQCTSETRLAIEVGGIASEVSDYTISHPGPGQDSLRLWRHAAALGHEVSAKVQLNNSWELSAVPWLPVFDLIRRHVSNLRDAGVRHLQLSWTLGGFPSPILRFATAVLDQNQSAEAFLRDWLGDELGTIADQAQQRFSRAFAAFPFHLGTAYTGPQNYAPMAPFWIEPTGWRATMIGFPYDNLDRWRSIYPVPLFEEQFARVAAGWQEGLALLEPWLGRNPQLDDLYTVAKAAGIHWISTWNHIRFTVARDRRRDTNNTADLAVMRAAIASEQAAVLDLIRLRAKDARIGYESSNHYYYTQQDLVEKLINLAYCAAQLDGAG